MIEVKIFLITCDESQHILPVTVYLLNKYFNTKLNIVIIGYTKLKYNFPNNVQYIELKQVRINSVNKKRKEIDRNIQQITEQYKTVERDIDIVSNYNLKTGLLTKLKEELGWMPSLQFEEGLSKTVDWYLENSEWLEHVTNGDYTDYYEKQYNLPHE